MNEPYSNKPLSHYTCRKILSPLLINGDLTKEVWQKAEKSPRFIDVIDGAPGLYDTHSALLWDDDYLYIAFWCEEPFVRASITKRDDLVFSENDVEVFIDGGDTYYEFQINALNTLYEVFYIWKDAYSQSDKYHVPEFDIFLHDALTFGGNHDRKNETFWQGSHPRKQRWVFRDWDFPGLKTAVQVQGEINRTDIPSKGWTVELAFPWKGMKWLSDGKIFPPKEGDTMNIFLGRYEICRLNGQDIQVGWAWDEIGTNDNHAPERFTQIRFSEEVMI